MSQGTYQGRKPLYHQQYTEVEPRWPGWPNTQAAPKRSWSRMRNYGTRMAHRTPDHGYIYPWPGLLWAILITGTALWHMAKYHDRSYCITGGVLLYLVSSRIEYSRHLIFLKCINHAHCVVLLVLYMMTSSNGNNGPRWIPRTKASDAELWCFLWSASE